MPRIHARLLGGFELRSQHGHELTLATRKSRALLAFLITEADKWHTRERLAGLLWSDRQPAQARHSLTQALGAIRKLGEGANDTLVESSSERVRLLASAVSADTLSFRGHLGYDAAKAAVFYTGPFLDGFAPLDAAFDEWLAMERVAFDQQACSALTKTIDQAKASGDFVAGLAAAKRWLALDRFSEPAYRRLMQLLVASGDQAEAIRQYQVCERLLNNELGISPSVETTLLLQTIRSQSRKVVAAVEPNSASGSSQAIELVLPDRPSIAVLPFVNLSSDPEQVFFADGIAEDIITELSKFRSVFVIARSSSFSFKGQALESREIGRRLGVRYIVEGSVRRFGSRVRVTAQLIDAVDDNHLWAERYDREIEDIFAVQDEVTRAIVTTIEPAMVDSERQRARRKPPESMDAWEGYQRGLWHLYQYNLENVGLGIAFMQKSMIRDPEFALAHAGLAFGLYLRVLLGGSMSSTTDLDSGLVAGKRAINLDPSDPFAHVALGRIHTSRGEHDQAVLHCDRAIGLNPSYASGHFGRAHSLWMSGRPAEALASHDEAIRLSPNDPMVWAFMASRSMALSLLERFDEALDWAYRALQQPNAAMHARIAALVPLGYLGRTGEATQPLEWLRRSRPDISIRFVREILPITDPVCRARYEAGLLKAGLPE